MPEWQVFVHWPVSSLNPQNNVSAVQLKQSFVIEFWIWLCFLRHFLWTTAHNIVSKSSRQSAVFVELRRPIVWTGTVEKLQIQNEAWPKIGKASDWLEATHLLTPWQLQWNRFWKRLHESQYMIEILTYISRMERF